MSLEPHLLRSIRVLSVLFVSGVLCSCASGTGSDDGSIRAANDARGCPATSTVPAFALVGSAPGTVLVSASGAASAFEAFVQFTHANEAPLTGGRLIVTDAVSLTPTSGNRTFAAQLPPLRSGTTYAVTLQVMQDTNLPPECQKSLAVSLGSFTGR